MPIYAFCCKNKKCASYFEHLCRYEEIAATRCPNCDSKKVEKQITLPSLAFAQPNESSKWESFDYRAGHLMEKAKAERRAAEAKSHVGATPYRATDINDLTKGEGILR